MSSDEGGIPGFLVSLFAAVDAARECDDFDECLIHAGLAIPEGWRPAHRAFAERYGLWWRPCPLCREYFGAHEDSGQYVPWPGDGEAVPGVRLLCRACSRPGRIERLAELAARGKMSEEEAVCWAALIYPESAGSEDITRAAIAVALRSAASPV